MLDVHGFAIRESAGVAAAVAAGSVTGAVTGAAAAVGSTSVTLTTPAGGAVALLAGDIVTFAGDTNQYVVQAALTVGASASGALLLNAPGLQKAISGTPAITVAGAATRNMAFQRNAIVLVTRAPALPEEGDMADDRMVITDPRSGLSFEVAMYRQYRQVRYEISIAYGSSVIKSQHTCLLLG